MLDKVAGLRSTLSPCTISQWLIFPLLAKLPAIRFRTCALTCQVRSTSTETNRLTELSPRCHGMVASSHAKLWDHCFGCWEHTLTLLSSSLLVSHSVLSFLSTCPATISEWASLSALASVSTWLIFVITLKHHSVLCYVVCTAASTSRHISKLLQLAAMHVRSPHCSCIYMVLTLLLFQTDSSFIMRGKGQVSAASTDPHCTVK